MKIFLDTNVILDLILKRQPFFDEVAKIMTLAELNNIQLYVSSITIVNANYISCKFADKLKVLESIKLIRMTFNIASVSETEIDKALFSNFTDFEDAVQYFSASKNNCNYIITRDNKDFRHSEIPVLAPTEFIKIVHNKL